MNYKSVSAIAIEWNISERSVRNYCAQGRIPGAAKLNWSLVLNQLMVNDLFAEHINRYIKY